MAYRMYLNIHCQSGTPESLLIRAATELFCDGPWLMGPKYAATHAYISWIHDDGTYYRVDGDVPYATAGFERDKSLPHLAWELVGTPEKLEAGRRKALSLAGVPYDFGEIATQLIPLPRFSVNIDLFKRAFICTRVALETAKEIGHILPVKNLYPEHMGHVADKQLSRSANA